MMFEIKTIDGQKVAVPLTADTGSGNPVGTIIAQYKKTSMTGYLYLDGRDTTGTADELETVYPALYSYLGNTNVLPDYREFTLVGAEENTTDVYNASTNPNGTIHDHDIYTEGQAKDDQLQDHYHVFNGGWGSGAMGSSWLRTDSNNPANQWYAIGTVSNGRKGTVTRGKRKAVYFYMKATVGVTEGTVTGKVEAGNYNPVSSNAVFEAVKEEVLWENPNPTSNFSATNLTSQTLGKDLSKYYAIYVYVKNANVGGYFSVCKCYKNLPITLTAPAGRYVHTRNCNLTDSQIEIDTGYATSTADGTTTVNNGVAVPIKIWGVKGV